MPTTTVEVVIVSPVSKNNKHISSARVEYFKVDQLTMSAFFHLQTESLRDFRRGVWFA